MNYSTGEPVCVCNPTGSVPVQPQVAIPSLTEQLAYLTGKAEKCFYAVNRIFYFLDGVEMAEDRMEDKTVTANLGYIVRLLDQITDKAERLGERWH